MATYAQNAQANTLPCTRAAFTATVGENHGRHGMPYSVFSFWVDFVGGEAPSDFWYMEELVCRDVLGPKNFYVTSVEEGTVRNGHWLTATGYWSNNYLENGTVTWRMDTENGWISKEVAVIDGYTQMDGSLAVRDNGGGYYALTATYPEGTRCDIARGEADSTEEFLYHTFERFG